MVDGCVLWLMAAWDRDGPALPDREGKSFVENQEQWAMQRAEHIKQRALHQLNTEVRCECILVQCSQHAVVYN